MEENERLDRIEAGLVGLASAVGQSIPEIEEIKSEGGTTPEPAPTPEPTPEPTPAPEWPNTPDGQIDLQKWTEMQDKLMAEKGIERPAADELLDEFFGKIKDGRLVEDQNGNWVPA